MVTNDFGKGQTIHIQKSLTDAKFDGMMSLLEKSTNGDKHGLLPFHSHILEYGNVTKLEGVRSSLCHYGRRDVRKNVGQSSARRVLGSHHGASRAVHSRNFPKSRNDLPYI
jgi:hypothetical protein